MVRDWYSLVQAFLAVAGGKHCVPKVDEEYLSSGEEFFVGLDKEQAERVYGLIFHVPGGSKR